MTLRTLVAAVLLVSATAGLAQDPGAAVEACRALGEAQIREDAPGAPVLAIDRDRHLFLQEREVRVGTQRAGALLTGNGAVVYETTPSVELTFVCLLAEPKRALFFTWLPRGAGASALAQCTRSDALRANVGECLESLLKLHEADMLHIAAERFHEARARDAAIPGSAVATRLNESGLRWAAYRDAECARQRDAAPRQDAAAVHGACLVELTRQRGATLRER